jgi:hypothetical protein
MVRLCTVLVLRLGVVWVWRGVVLWHQQERVARMKAEGAVLSPRTQHMLDTISDLKNNKRKAAQVG